MVTKVIRDLIGKGKTKQALEEIKGRFEQLEMTDEENQILLLTSRFNANRKKELSGTRSAENISTEYAKIREALLELNKKLSNLYERSVNKNINNGNVNTGGGDFILGDGHQQTRRATEGGQQNPLSNYYNTNTVDMTIHFDEKSLLQIQKENKRRDNGLTEEATELLTQTNAYRLAKMANPDRYDRRNRKANSISKSIEELIEKAENTKFDREENFEEGVLKLLDGELTYKNLKQAYMRMATKGYKNEPLLEQIKAKFDDEDVKIEIADTLDYDLSSLI